MTASILDETNGEGVYLNRFFRAGRYMYQITDQNGIFVVLTERQLDLLAARFQMFRVEHSEKVGS